MTVSLRHMTVRSVPIGDRTLNYAEAGGGPPLLLIHGFPLDHEMWLPQLRTFGQMRRVLAPDLYGFGAAGGVGHESLDAHADDLARLLDHLRIDRVVAAGLSMGGYIALALWRRHPERLAGLVLADTRATADTEEGRRGRLEAAERVARDGTAALLETMGKTLLGPDANGRLRSEVCAMMERQTPAGVAAALRAIAARPDSTAELPRIEVPTLVLVGTEDVITPVAEARVLAAGIPNATLVLIPRGGHLANLEEPGAFNGATREFLTALDARAGL